MVSEISIHLTCKHRLWLWENSRCITTVCSPVQFQLHQRPFREVKQLCGRFQKGKESLRRTDLCLNEQGTWSNPTTGQEQHIGMINSGISYKLEPKPVSTLCFMDKLFLKLLFIVIFFIFLFLYIFFILVCQLGFPLGEFSLSHKNHFSRFSFG